MSTSALINVLLLLQGDSVGGTSVTATTEVIPTTVPTTTAGMFDFTIYNSNIYYYYYYYNLYNYVVRM